MNVQTILKASAFTAAIALAIGPLSARAVDGVALLDQAKALAGNVTAGDAPGFPITITQPGSYRLDGNLTVPFGTTGIVVTVSNVAIDLNGFTISGTAPTQSASGYAIQYSGPLPARGLTVRNGVITNFATPFFLGFASDPKNPFAVLNGAEATIQDLYVQSGIPGLGASFELGSSSRVINVTGAGLDLNIACPSVIAYSIFSHITPTSNHCALTGNASPF
jgi:hypothetical protein